MISINTKTISLDWDVISSLKGIKNLLISLLDNNAFQFQVIGVLLGILITFISFRVIKKVFLNLENEENTKNSAILIQKIVQHLFSPLVLFLCISIFLAAFEQIGWSTNELLRPLMNFSIAWICFRVFSLCIRDRTWLRLIGITIFILASLHSFGLLEKSINLLGHLAFNLGERKISVLDFINGLGVLFILLWLSSFLGSTAEKKIRKLPNLPPSLQVLLGKILRSLLVFISFVIALSTIGLDLTSFALLGGAVGVGIGFGLQKVVSNLVSGLILLIDRSIKPGDVIEIEGTYGWINSLRARYASVITRDGKEHLIPNEDLITNRVINWSFSDRNVRVRVPIGISYDSNPRLAIELCLQAAKSTSRTLMDPEPKCLLTGFGDNSIDLELRFWIDDPSNGVGNVRSAVLLSIWDKFNENNIEIPYPQRDVRIRNIAPTKNPEPDNKKD